MFQIFWIFLPPKELDFGGEHEIINYILARVGGAVNTGCSKNKLHRSCF